MSLFDARGVHTPGQAVGEVCPELFVGGNYLHSCSVDVQMRGRSASLLEIHHHLFVFGDFVFSAPHSQLSQLLLVCHLAAVGGLLVKKSKIQLQRGEDIPSTDSLFASVCGKIVLKGELKSKKSSLTYESFFSRCVRAVCITAEMASAVEL